MPDLNNDVIASTTVAKKQSFQHNDDDDDAILTIDITSWASTKVPSIDIFRSIHFRFQVTAQSVVKQFCFWFFFKTYLLNFQHKFN